MSDISLVSSTDSAEDVAAALSTPTAAPETKTPAAPETKTAETKTDGAPDQAAADAAAKEAADKAAGDGKTETDVEKAEKASKSARERREAKIQSQIDKKVAQREQARRDAEAEEARLALLKAEAAQLQADITLKKAHGTPAAPATPGTPAADTPPKPKLADTNADGTPKFANYEEFMDSLMAWHADDAARKAEAVATTAIKKQETAERDRIERARLTRDEQDALAAYDKTLEEFKVRTPDFDAVLEASKDAVQEIVDDLGPKALDVIDTYTINDALNGPAIQHYLATHAEELREIAELKPAQQLIRLARLDERLTSATPAPARTARPAVSRAPEPIAPVGGSPTSSTVSAEDEDYQTYKARRDAEERRAR